MSGPLTYESAFDYLLGLGLRFSPIGRSELTFSGEPAEGAEYPLVLVEADPQGSELIGEGQRPTGQDSFTIAVQVLTQAKSTATADLHAAQVQTNSWVDSLCEQLRHERPQQLAGVGRLALPGVAGSALACGWRVELQLKVVKNIDRDATRALFTPEL